MIGKNVPQEQVCNTCKKKYYRIENFAFTESQYREFFNYNTDERKLLDSLPNQEIKERYMDLLKAVRTNRVNLQGQALRALIDAHIAIQHNRDENKYLSKAIEDTTKLSQDAKTFFLKKLLPQTNNAAHSKTFEKADSKYIEAGIEFMRLIMKQEYQLEQEKKNLLNNLNL